MGRLLRNRNSRLYLSGQILSTFGDSALILAMGIWMKVLTGSFAAAGLVFFFQADGGMLAPIGGMLADRVRLRPLLVIANLATAGLVLLLLLVRDRHEAWLIYAVAFGYGISFSVLGPAQTALAQAIVPAELLGDANGILQTAGQGLRLLTPLAGAGLFAAFGAAPVIIGDAATFIIAVATLAAIRVREDRAPRHRENWLGELTAGARHIAATRALRQLAIATALVVAAYGLSETVVFAVVSEGLRRPAAFLGVLIAAQGVGAIAAGASAAALLRKFGEVLVAGLGMAYAALGYLLLIARALPVVLAGSVLLGASLPWIIVAVFTLLQRRTPPTLMGRTDAAFTVMYSLPQTIGIALGAGLIMVLGYRVVLVAISVLMSVAATYLLTRRETSSPSDDTPPPLSPAPQP